MSNYNVEISADNTITVGFPSTGSGVAGPQGGNMSNYNVEISADNTITIGLPSTGNGVAGPRGEKGYSAYEVAIKNGYTGTEAEWLATLKGEKGEKGEPGVNGIDGKPGKDGVDGVNGADGKPGTNGLSAYELAAKNGFSGNESAWLASLKGDKGDQGPKGDKGQNGVNGADGKDGLSAYAIAVKNGYNGTEADWVNKWLRGTIVSADVDDSGVMSMTDINGNVINTTLAPIAKATSSASAAEASAQAAANSASKAATHDTNAASSLAETRKSEQNAKTSEQNAAASAAQAAANAKKLQADWKQTDDTQMDFIKNKPDVLLKSGGTVTGTIAATAFSGPLSGDVNGNVAGTADKAVADGNGNNIVNTYVTKSALATGVTTGMGKVTTLTATDSTLTNLTVTGQTTVPTANAGNSSKAIANTEFVAKSLASLVNGAPDQLNTLNELAKALGNDSNFAATMTAELAKKLNSTEAESTYATKTEAGVPYQIKRNTAYKVGDVLTSPSLPPGCVIVVTQAGATGSTEPDWTTIKSNMGGVISDGTVTFYINDTLSKHSIGDIVYKPTTKTGEHEYLLPLDGQTVDGTKYKRLVDYLGSATLPNLNGRYLRADSTPGQMVEAGLPNITGQVRFLAWQDSINLFNGAFYTDATAHNFNLKSQFNGNNYGGVTVYMDASRSSAIYGKSTTVTPLTYTVRAYICYA